MFSIVIPTWNNLSYVRLCVESIRKNSHHPFEIILHINDGSDGTSEWAKHEGLPHTHTATNAGICVAVNSAASLAKGDHIVYMNDDMYCCPGWDAALLDEIKSLPDDNFMISSTMIEPVDTGNKAVIVADFGKSTESFKEKALLESLTSLQKSDWSGSTWPPVVISKRMWHIIGGFSIEFSPGMASDDDLSMKMWAAGCRYFKGVGNSLVYHFQTKSTTRIRKNDGRKTFIFKWGITSSFFNKYFLKKGENFSGPLQDPPPVFLQREARKVWFKKKFVY